LAARQVSATSACTTGRSWPSTRTEKRRHRGRASGVRKECPPYACSLPVGESNLSGLAAPLGLGWGRLIGPRSPGIVPGLAGTIARRNSRQNGQQDCADQQEAANHG